MKEVQVLISPKFELLSLADLGTTKELQETHDTLEGNALQKAQYVFDTYRIPCFADDTGVAVDALDGAPGVHSAHYAGIERSSEANVALLLHNLKNTRNRKAQFRTVIALVAKHIEKIFIGVAEGHIAEQPRGKHGFAYDVLFVPKGYAKTYAELGFHIKNKISARASALKECMAFLNNRFSTPEL